MGPWDSSEMFVRLRVGKNWKDDLWVYDIGTYGI